MAICEHGKVLEILPTEAQEVFDVSGAGDTVIATLTAALSAGANLHDAAKIANAAAGCVVGHMGTVPVDIEELKNSFSRH
jgi:D-beta-D-heptose 7-phosphate kinase/D-beta-D-heptose 1-phosphate adenosyltransferase